MRREAHAVKKGLCISVEIETQTDDVEVNLVERKKEPSISVEIETCWGH